MSLTVSPDRGFESLNQAARLVDCHWIKMIQISITSARSNRLDMTDGCVREGISCIL
jgi:hypothetical protein